jgi:hypothetical protein
MPPEQGQGFSDVVDDRLGFGAHLFPQATMIDGTTVPADWPHGRDQIKASLHKN